MHKTSYKGYLDKCMPSEIMRTYLKSVELSPRQVVDLIMYSPADIDVKMEELGRIAADKTNDVLLKQMASEALKGIQEAIIRIDEKRCCYSLEFMGYCENIQDNIYGLEAIYRSLKDTKDFFSGLIESEGFTGNEMGWSKVKKWVENEDGDYEVVHTYIFRGNKIVFATNNPWVSKKKSIKGAGTNTAKTGICTGVGVFTIMEVREGKGSDTGWGRLKSGAGWISLDYCQRV